MGSYGRFPSYPRSKRPPPPRPHGPGCWAGPRVRAALCGVRRVGEGPASRRGRPARGGIASGQRRGSGFSGAPRPSSAPPPRSAPARWRRSSGGCTWGSRPEPCAFTGSMIGGWRRSTGPAPLTSVVAGIPRGSPSSTRPRPSRAPSSSSSHGRVWGGCRFITWRRGSPCPRTRRSRPSTKWITPTGTWSRPPAGSVRDGWRPRRPSPWWSLPSSPAPGDGPCSSTRRTPRLQGSRSRRWWT